jgi:hypothetical protein
VAAAVRAAEKNRHEAAVAALVGDVESAGLDPEAEAFVEALSPVTSQQGERQDRVASRERLCFGPLQKLGACVYTSDFGRILHAIEQTP